MKRTCGVSLLVVAGCGLLWACAFDDTLREYLNSQFWLPLARRGRDFAKPVRQLSAPFAGMVKVSGSSDPLDRLRAAYQALGDRDESALQKALADARASRLSPKDREEVDLIDAKFDLREGSDERLSSSMKKLRAFLRSARTPEFRSEARGWIAHIHYLRDEQSAAGKIYFDELNRKDSNIGRDTLLTSLRMTYGYEGGEKLVQQLEDYFDTPEHAAFAITLATNPHWERDEEDGEPQPPEPYAPPFERINQLLVKHEKLFRSERGSAILAVLGMRNALRAGDPGAALLIASNVPANADVRRDADFLWMLGSARFLSKDYSGAEAPLVELASLKSAPPAERAAAAYGLCGVYQKTSNYVERIRWALWLDRESRREQIYTVPVQIENLGVYWAASGFDLGLLLDTEAPMEALEEFVQRYPKAPNLRMVRYAIAVRLTRADRYQEAADLYAAIGARPRAARMRRLAELWRETQRADATAEQRLEARYQVAALLEANSTGVYFNDMLWYGFQRYALNGKNEYRMTKAERQLLLQQERQLKDEQEELWRAYLLLKDVIRDAGPTPQGRKAAELALRCLRRISERFGREAEIRAAVIEVNAWLKKLRQTRPGA